MDRGAQGEVCTSMDMLGKARLDRQDLAKPQLSNSTRSCPARFDCDLNEIQCSGNLLGSLVLNALAKERGTILNCTVSHVDKESSPGEQAVRCLQIKADVDLESYTFLPLRSSPSRPFVNEHRRSIQACGSATDIWETPDYPQSWNRGHASKLVIGTPASRAWSLSRAKPSILILLLPGHRGSSRLRSPTSHIAHTSYSQLSDYA
jgi:hypothetical protein